MEYPLHILEFSYLLVSCFPLQLFQEKRFFDQTGFILKLCLRTVVWSSCLFENFPGRESCSLVSTVDFRKFREFLRIPPKKYYISGFCVP